MPVGENFGERSTRNAGHRQLDQSDSEKTAHSGGMCCFAIDRSRFETQALQSLLDGGQVRG